MPKKVGRPAKLPMSSLIANLQQASTTAFGAVHAVSLRLSEIDSLNQVTRLEKLAEELMETRRRCYAMATRAGDNLRGLNLINPPDRKVSAYGGRIVRALSPKEIDRRRRRAAVPPTTVQARREAR